MTFDARSSRCTRGGEATIVSGPKLTALRTWLVVGSMTLLLLTVCSGTALVLWPKGAAPVPLVDHDAWRLKSGFFRVPEDAISPLEVPRPQNWTIDFWRSWSPETLGTLATIRSQPFAQHRFL